MSINYRSGWSAEFADQREAYWQKRLAGAEATITRLREALDWIEAEPEDPEKVQARARAALAPDAEQENA